MRLKRVIVCLAVVISVLLFADSTVLFAAEEVMYTTGRANVRAGKGTDYKILATLDKGSSVKIIEDSGDGWLLIDYGGKRGCVSESLISKDGKKPKEKESDQKIESSFDIDEEILKNLQAEIDAFDGKLGFYAESQDGLLSLSYNPDMSIFAASTMKVPMCMFICKNFENGEKDDMRSVHDISKKPKSRKEESGLRYHPKYYPEPLWCYYGENVLTHDLYRTRDLMVMALQTSDNLAKEILQKEYVKKDDFNKWLKDIGCKRSAIYGDSEWMSSTPRDLVTIWKEYYKYSTESDYGKTLFDTSKKTTQTYLRVLKKDYAAKFGYTNDDTKVYLETGMILGDSPYYIALTFKFKGDEMNPDIVKDFIKLIDSAIGENVVIEESDDEEIVISEDD